MKTEREGMDVSVILRNLGTHPGKRFIQHTVLVFLLAALAVCGASAEELESMGLRPEELVPVTRDYSFTVDQGASCALIPIPRNE